MSEVQDSQQKSSQLLERVEEQVDTLLKSFEDQEAQIWAYVFGGIIAILIGLVVAYYYSQVVRENRKSTLERLRDTVRGGLGL